MPEQSMFLSTLQTRPSEIRRSCRAQKLQLLLLMSKPSDLRPSTAPFKSFSRKDGSNRLGR